MTKKYFYLLIKTEGKKRIADKSLLHSQFPTIDGLQSRCYAQKPCFRPTTDTFIQILDTHPKDGGYNWVTVATYENPVSGAVKLYDSGLSLGVSTSIERSVCNMLAPQIVQLALN